MAEGVDGLLHEATRPAGKPPLTPETIERVVEMTLAEPPGETTHWTGRAMAKAAGVSHRSVQRIWAAHGLKPHRVRIFKLSNDAKFAAKLQDVVGLYIDPPEHALVLSVDEKSQIQALDRSQPGLPMKKGRCGTMTHDYKRHGTTTLFAALDVLEGRVIGQCMARHRHAPVPITVISPVTPITRVFGAMDGGTEGEQVRSLTEGYHRPQSEHARAATPPCAHGSPKNRRLREDDSGSLPLVCQLGLDEFRVP